MFGNRTFDFLHYSGPGDSDRTARFHEMREVVEVEVVRPKIREGVDTHDGVEEVRRERERSGIGMERENAILDAGIQNSLHIVRGGNPQIGGPNLYAKFAVEKNRRRGPAAAEVEHPHAGPQ